MVDTIDLNDVKEHPLDYVYQRYGDIYDRVRVFRPKRHRQDYINISKVVGDEVHFYETSLKRHMELIEDGVITPIKRSTFEAAAKVTAGGKMSHGDATKIFLECFKDVEQGEDIRPNDYAEDEIADAIYEVAYLTTHNGITKDSIINALRWLFSAWA